MDRPSSRFSVRRVGRGACARFFARVLIAALVLSLATTPSQASIARVSLPTPPQSHGLPVSVPLPTGKVVIGVVVVSGRALGLTKTAFGELIGHSPNTDEQPYAFAGEPLDLNVGWQYHRARWMDPESGRFASMDPFAANWHDPPSIHRYAYGGGDPVNVIDPTGLFGLVTTLAAVNITQVVFGIATMPLRSADTGLVRIVWSVDLAFEGAALDLFEEPALKLRTLVVAKTAVLGLPVDFVEAGGGPREIQIRGNPASFTSEGGEALSSLKALVYYGALATALSDQFASELGLTKRRQKLEALAEAVGAVIAHEFAHMTLWGSADELFMHQTGDPAAYDHANATAAWYLPGKSWSPRVYGALATHLAR